jgi:hypothetical protein
VRAPTLVPAGVDLIIFLASELPMLKNVLLSALVLGGVACVVHAEDDVCGYDEHYSCYLEYTPYFGYERVCEWVADPVLCIDEAEGTSRYRRPSGASDGSGSDEGSPYPEPAEHEPEGPHAGGPHAGGPHAGEPDAGPPDTQLPAAEEPDAGAPDAEEPQAEQPQAEQPAEQEPNCPSGCGTSSPGDEHAEPGCLRNSQCGTGLCVEGQCLYSCETGADCGTGDACLEVTGTLVCCEPETPELECTRSAECGSGEVCLNAVCHDGCETTADCTNPLDRCEGAICVPDRSVVSECLLDRECPSGHACIDAACLPR